MGKVILALLLAGILAGCTTTGFCALADPIYTAPADVNVISDQLVDGLVSHNETGSRICGWKR